MLQLKKTLHATTKTRHRQINKYFFKNKTKWEALDRGIPNKFCFSSIAGKLGRRGRVRKEEQEGERGKEGGRIRGRKASCQS